MNQIPITLKKNGYSKNDEIKDLYKDKIGFKLSLIKKKNEWYPYGKKIK